MDYRLPVFASLVFTAVDMMDGIALIFQQSFFLLFNDVELFPFRPLYVHDLQRMKPSAGWGVNLATVCSAASDVFMMMFAH